LTPSGGLGTRISPEPIIRKGVPNPNSLKGEKEVEKRRERSIMVVKAQVGVLREKGRRRWIRGEINCMKRGEIRSRGENDRPLTRTRTKHDRKNTTSWRKKGVGKVAKK